MTYNLVSTLSPLLKKLQSKSKISFLVFVTILLHGDDDRVISYVVDLMKPGNTVILRNAKIDMFKGSMRLAVDKWGRIEVTEPANFVVKEDNNLSLIEYELVNVVEE